MLGLAYEKKSPKVCTNSAFSEHFIGRGESCRDEKESRDGT
jgi:hypothetical protein